MENRVIQRGLSINIYALLVYSALVLLQFQNLGLRLMGSVYDLSNFLFLLSISILIYTSKQKFKSYILFVAFICFQLIVWVYFQIAPIHRVFSGLVWFGGLVAIVLFAHKGIYNRILAFKILKFSLLFLTILIFFEYLYLGVRRPQAFLDEPSYAGLLLFSGAAMMLYTILYQYSYLKKVSRRDFILLIFFVSAATLTKSLHITTFFLYVLCIFYILGKFNKTSLMMVSGLTLLLGFVISISDLTHISSRILISDDTTSLSLLSWLRGFDQAKYVVTNSPLFGFGLGSTGYFQFESGHSETLAALGFERLNLTDSYSGLFRVTIELGLLTTFAVISLMYRQLRRLKKTNYVHVFSSHDVHQRSLALFGITLLLGVLLKEPTYSRSFVYVAIFLCASNFSLTDLKGFSKEPLKNSHDYRT